MKKLPDLYTINTRLFDLAERAGDLLPEFSKKEIEYESKYYDFVLKSNLPSAEKRQAEAYKLIEQEPIFMEYKSMKTEIKTLYFQKDCLSIISSNLRNLSYGGE